MSESEHTFGTLGDRFGDLGPTLVARHEEPLARFDPPVDRRVVTASAIARDVLAAVAPLHVSSVYGSAPGLVVRALAKEGARSVVVVADAAAAEEVARDAAFYLGASAPPVLTLLASEASPYAEVNPDRRGAQNRLAVLSHLHRGLPWSALVVPVSAFARRVVPRSILDATALTLREGEEIDREDIARRLVAAGYARSPVVEDPASFALRGGLVDLWPVESTHPFRIELYGDMILSIRSFDPDGQRTFEKAEIVHVSLARESPLTSAAMERARERILSMCDAANVPTSKARSLAAEVTSGRAFFGADALIPAFVDLEPVASYLPPDAVFVLEDPPSLTRALRDDVGRAVADLGRPSDIPPFPIETFYSTEGDVAGEIQKRRTVCLHRAPTVGAASPGTLEAFEASGEETPSLFTFDQDALRRAVAAARTEKGKASALDPLVRYLRELEAEHFATVIVARAETQVERLATLLGHRGIGAVVSLGRVDPLLFDPGTDAHARALGKVTIGTGTLARGVVAPAERLAIITEEDVFGVRVTRKGRASAAATGKRKARAFVEDLKSLAVGDFVVHIEHGVGRYHGLLHRDVGGTRIDLIAIEYAGGDRLYLPVYRLNQIEKLSGSESTPKLDRLGGSTFQKTKQRAMRDVRQMADELLKLYAERHAARRPPLPAPSDDYRAFEATFPFDETPDQSIAIGDVEKDLEAPSPMDRLVCGDVGFGKTEVALRAAFRVASEGRQVAVLCPTTVLAQQHFLGFAQRMSAHALTIRTLSRFTSTTDARATLAGLKQGSVDVVIGTHRLLSKDVHFKRLGLLVVDEEQRFGVTHKERVKQLRMSVDVLTLSATPIPRTLQMAVSGLRDMSVIATPPIDRRAIRTVVSKHDESVIRSAVVREMDRGGQTFYVYNRVDGLYERAARLQELVPTARIAVGHGQMSDAALEQTMLDFVEGRYDVLCSTAIIESGLDIPRANTMIVDRADMFGLSQLYQLRGRVGRSRERAVCYLLVPPQSQLTDEARARIEALERHTDLGSGFHVASLDLELRGAGDLLGAEQSGVVASVGFELFTTMLEEAVAELSGETVVHEIDTDLTIDEEALLPDDYVEDVGVRLSLYKRFACAESEAGVDDLALEMEDRFGAPPAPAKNLVRMMRAKVELRKLRALGCDAAKKLVTMHLGEGSPIDTQKLLALVQMKRSPYKLTPDMRLSRRFGDGEVKSGLDALDTTLEELARCL